LLKKNISKIHRLLTPQSDFSTTFQSPPTPSSYISLSLIFDLFKPLKFLPENFLMEKKEEKDNK